MPRYAPIGQKKQWAARLRRGQNQAAKVESAIRVRQAARQRQANVNSKVNRNRVSYDLYRKRIKSLIDQNFDLMSKDDSNFYYDHGNVADDIAQAFSGRPNPRILRLMSEKGYKSWARSGKSVPNFFSDWRQKAQYGTSVRSTARKNVPMNPRKSYLERSARPNKRAEQRYLNQER